MNLTPTQRLTCLLALLDDVIAKDDARTPGEWEVIGGNRIYCGSRFMAEPYACEDASHIAIGSISQGRNARALKEVVEAIQYSIENFGGSEAQRSRLASILSLYPDEILIRYLKP